MMEDEFTDSGGSSVEVAARATKNGQPTRIHFHVTIPASA
jgi:hypothetical protein